MDALTSGINWRSKNNLGFSSLPVRIEGSISETFSDVISKEEASIDGNVVDFIAAALSVQTHPFVAWYLALTDWIKYFINLIV